MKDVFQHVSHLFHNKRIVVSRSDDFSIRKVFGSLKNKQSHSATRERRDDTGRDDERDAGLEMKVALNVFSLFQTTLSFLVYDRDSNWQGQCDDFMGSCNLQMTLVRNILLHLIGRMQR